VLRVLYISQRRQSLTIADGTGVGWLHGKRNQDARWRLENVHKGNMHFTLEEPGVPSRFITLKALRILKYFSLI
jgi:hypothetical protein